MDEKRDVAIFGLWWSCNYGSLMTYYSLYRAIKDMGYSVIMIDRPGFPPDHPVYHTHGRRFAKENFEAISPVFGFQEMRKLNDYADCFVMGSDQVWNFGICKPYQGAFFLNFVADGKKRMSYAASFGHDGFFAPENETEIAKGHLKKFDYISVREEDGVGIVNHTFGLLATRVLDPVFIANPNIYDELIDKSSAKQSPLEEGEFIASYLLDITPEKKEALLYISEKLEMPIINLMDGYLQHFEENKQKLGLPNAAENLQVEDWLYYVKNCSYFFTDSCHGASFAILFQKPFTCIPNEKRGMSRFRSLAEVFGLQKRFITDPLEIKKRQYLLETMDYTRVNAILEMERKRSGEWLEEALEAPVQEEKNNEYVEEKRPLHDFAAGIYHKLFKK